MLLIDFAAGLQLGSMLQGCVSTMEMLDDWKQRDFALPSLGASSDLLRLGPSASLSILHGAHHPTSVLRLRAVLRTSVVHVLLGRGRLDEAAVLPMWEPPRAASTSPKWPLGVSHKVDHTYGLPLVPVALLLQEAL